jgi:hypothetical protein
MVESFENYPKTISEHKSDKTRSPLDWTVRDALVSMLRMIDAKEIKPDTIVIAYRERPENGDGTADIFNNGFMVAGCTSLEAMGLCVATSQDIWSEASK